MIVTLNHLKREQALCSPDEVCNADFSLLIFFFLLVCYYWGNRVCVNTVHTTNCGVFGRWYFGKQPSVRSSLKVACTTSFGSISFGSLIVAIIQATVTMMKILRQAAERDGNLVLTLIFCCLECICACIQDIVEAFNYFCYVQVAIRGMSFCESAKATWALCTFGNIYAIIGAQLIGTIINFGALMCGLASALISTWFMASSGGMKLDTMTLLLMFWVALILSTVVAGMVLAPFQSGFAAIVVCWAEDKTPLEHHSPALGTAFETKVSMFS